MNFEQRQGIEIEMRQAPLQFMERVEVVDNMDEQLPDGRVRPLEEVLVGIRDHTIATEGSQIILNAAVGRSLVSKSTALANLNDFVQQDRPLRKHLEKNNLKLKIYSCLFSLGMIAAAMVGKLPPLRQGEWVPEHYQEGSAFNLNSIILPYLWDSSHEGELICLSYESGPPTSYPKKAKIPVEVEGTDRGNSTFYDLALRKSTRSKLNVLAVTETLKVRETLLGHRKSFDPREKNFGDIFRGDVRYVFTTDTGEEIDVSTLSSDEQRRIAAILYVATATPAAIVRSDKEIDEIEVRLYSEGKIKSKDDSSYFEFIREGLDDFPQERFHVVLNKFFRGKKTFNLDYLLRHNLTLQFFPDLPTFIIEEYVNRAA